ncbi:class I SAM-dependent methyltransferase [Mariprofundus sp. NF]|uniref:class I SAM-dependent methyltransferase n=1 Tax=Mariprofundus sp. NF TaxID=2608716 RepID=UPI0015A4D60E|nr:class I SAM-dependent methyltransferase [Mariprofundus sp. NF]NWF39497.1 class I SAM-dependent methyltransferase [Mariprofundus sp. NF]
MSRLGSIYASVYNSLCGVHPRLYPWHFQWLAAKYIYADLKETLPSFHGKVLDVGCGDKPYQIWLSENVQHIGIDVYEGEFVDHIVKHDEAWPIETASMENVICTQVLEHVQDVDEVLNEIYRVLVPGGEVLITAPFIYQEHGAPNDFRRFSYYGVLSLLSNRFEVIQVNKQGGIGSTLGLLLLSWMETESNMNFPLKILKGMFFPVWLLFSAIVNIVAIFMDKIDVTDCYYNNVSILARKK